MKRRGFFGALAVLPFVGSLFKARRRPSVSDFGTILCWHRDEADPVCAPPTIAVVDRFLRDSSPLSTGGILFVPCNMAHLLGRSDRTISRGGATFEAWTLDPPAWARSAA